MSNLMVNRKDSVKPVFSELDLEKFNYETVEYNAGYIISLAKYYIQNCSWECPMITSAELCYVDSLSLYENGNYQYAGIRALKSLAYTIGIGHPDYIICKAKTE